MAARMYREMCRLFVDCGAPTDDAPTTEQIAELIIRVDMKQAPPQLLGFDLNEALARVLADPEAVALETGNLGRRLEPDKVVMIAKSLQNKMLLLPEGGKAETLLRRAARHGFVPYAPPRLWATFGFSESLGYRLQTVASVRDVHEVSWLYIWWKFWEPIQRVFGTEYGLWFLAALVIGFFYLVYRLITGA